MKEENEDLEAVQNNDLVEIADALGDMMYIFGTIIEHGLQQNKTGFDEIQRSNMSKLDELGILYERGK
jgi:predicted HAD superfamily Cof-like phosphohydrolase